MIEVFGVDVADDGEDRAGQEEGTVALVDLRDDQVALLSLIHI